MRTLIDIPDSDIDWLDRKAAAEGKSRAAVVREAIERFRHAEARNGIERFFGLWKQRHDVGDGLDYQQRVRGEWDRDGDSSEG